MDESPGIENGRNAKRDRRESGSDPRFQVEGAGMEANPRFSEEERRLLADFFILLDQMDRAQAREMRKAA